MSSHTGSSHSEDIAASDLDDAVAELDDDATAASDLDDVDVELTDDEAAASDLDDYAYNFDDADTDLDDTDFDVDDFDPMDMYNMDDFVAESMLLDEYSEKIIDRLKEKIASGPSRRRRQIGTRRYIPRNREAGNDDLVANYFSESPIYTDEMFRRRFRMRKSLFLRIVSALSEWSPYFTNRVDATGRAGHSPLQKCTAAIRMLAYGTPADQLDEVLKIGPSTSLECLGKFAKGVIEIFGDEYLRAPRIDELESML
uniref:DAD domain-containing protein n=1 Tax=Oryza brachyantha TaxID=4533 RepID=J3LR19_ORYBR